jgi:amylosucrase
LGDEIGTLNDYEFRPDPAKAGDSRWVHRPRHDWRRAEQRLDAGTVPGRIYRQLRRLIGLRQQTAAFSGHELDVVHAGSELVFGYVRHHRDARVLALANFSEQEVIIGGNVLRIHGLSPMLTDLVTGASVPAHQDFALAPYQFAWLQS